MFNFFFYKILKKEKSIHKKEKKEKKKRVRIELSEKEK